MFRWLRSCHHGRSSCHHALSVLSMMRARRLYLELDGHACAAWMTLEHLLGLLLEQRLPAPAQEQASGNSLISHHFFFFFLMRLGVSLVWRLQLSSSWCCCRFRSSSLTVSRAFHLRTRPAAHDDPPTAAVA
jgi:hypothetical protein